VIWYYARASEMSDLQFSVGSQSNPANTCTHARA